MRDLIVNLCPTGMIPTKEMTPHVPIAAEEIVDDVLEVAELGITMVHMHARDPVSGKPTWEREGYARIIEGIRAQDGELIICVSTSGRDVSEVAKRADVLELTGDLKPDMASLTLSSMNFARQASVNSPETVQELARRMLERGILPELEAFDTGMLNYIGYLESKDLIRGPQYINILLGNIATAQADLLHSGVLTRDVAVGSFWSFAGLGNAQLRANSLAIASGGGVRVGLEDNIWYDQSRSQLATNRSLVERIHRLAEIHERSIMPAADMRKALGLAPGNGEYGLARQ